MACVILSQSSFVTVRKHYSKPYCIELDRHPRTDALKCSSLFVHAMCFCDDIKGALMKKGTS